MAHRKMEDVSIQNRDLLQVIAKREESIHNTQVHLDEKARECDSLYRQVEQAREEAQKQVPLQCIVSVSLTIWLHTLFLCKFRMLCLHRWTKN